jgi:protein SCO1/2
VLRALPPRLLLLAACLAPACRGDAPSAAPAKRYPIEGRVVEVELTSRSVTLAHEDIPGFMPAMTMPFVVLEKDAALLQAMAPGASLRATLVVSDSRYWLEELVVVGAPVPIAGASPLAAPREPQPGEAVPDVALVDQDGRALRLADYRGKALALTFVFTRCPMPDFCPLLMRNFAAAEELLAKDPGLAGRTRLLTISFDPAHDTPAVLRAFGRPFQKTSPPFTHWRLATGKDEAIRTLGGSLGLDYAEESASFTHNLRTAVVDPQGRLRRLFHGNDWSADDLVAELRAAAGA